MPTTDPRERPRLLDQMKHGAVIVDGRRYREKTPALLHWLKENGEQLQLLENWHLGVH